MRNRNEESNIDDQFLIDLEKYHKEIFNESLKSNILKIDATQEFENDPIILSNILNKIKEWISKI